MKLALLNAKYRQDRTSGGNAHIDQFVRNVVALGHEVWMDEVYQHPSARALPLDNLLDSLHALDVVYVRVGGTFPEACKQAAMQKSRRHFSGTIVWEFNVAPDYGALKGASNTDIQRTIGLFRQYGSSCDLVVCVSQALNQFVRDELGLGKVLTIPNGSDPALFHPDVPAVSSIRSGPDVLNVVWLGSAHIPWHNLELVRRTARLLWERNSEVQIAFHIIGTGLDETHELPPNLSYHGPIAYECLPQWLSAMDVGLVLYHPGPADYNSPLKMFDYMSSGLAVIGSTHPQIADVLSECGQLDSLLLRDDPEELAKKLLEMSGNRDRVADLGRMARQRVVDKYNWRQSISSTLEAINCQAKNKQNTHDSIRTKIVR